MVLTVAIWALAAAPASALCSPRSTQSIYDRNPAAVVATVVEQRQGSVVVDVQRSLKGGLPLGRLALANPFTSIAFGRPVGSRVGLGLRPFAQGGYEVNGCNSADPDALALVIDARPTFVVGGQDALLLLDRRGRELRRIGVSGLVTAVARGQLAGTVALRTAAGVEELDVFRAQPSFGRPRSVRASRAFRVTGRHLLRDGRRVATLPPGRWTGAVSLR